MSSITESPTAVTVPVIGGAGAALVPLQIHFNDRGRAKVLLGLGEGRKKSDKRAAIATRDWQRDKARLLRNRG
jgi:SsrA-binding protein